MDIFPPQMLVLFNLKKQEDLIITYEIKYFWLKVNYFLWP